MTPRTLRGRAALAAAFAIVVAVTGLGIAIEALASRDLHGTLDRTLRDRAAEVAQLSATAPALLTAPGALEAPLGGRELSVEILDRRGRIVARSLGLGGRVLPAARQVSAAIRDGVGGYVMARLGSEPVRLYIAPLAASAGVAGGGAVVVAGSTTELETTLRRLRILILLSALVAATLAGLGVRLLIGRALRPLRELAYAAEQIEESADPRQRLPEDPAAEEPAQLARTLNAMLAALERAGERERRFVADASHELRTPLTALRGNAAYVARHGADVAALADLEADAVRISRLVDDLLALSREDAAGPPAEPVRLDELALAAAEASDRVDAEVSGPILVRGDREALARALANLVENAERYGPAGGRIAVSATRDGERALLTVRDEGAGLGEADAAQAFERFWRGTEAGGSGGSGLGLALVRATAERHGGRALVDGSAFSLELPRLRDLSGSAGTTRNDAQEKGLP